MVRVECKVMAVRSPFEMGGGHRRLSATLNSDCLGPGAPERPLVCMLLQYWLCSQPVLSSVLRTDPFW